MSREAHHHHRHGGSNTKYYYGTLRSTARCLRRASMSATPDSHHNSSLHLDPSLTCLSVSFQNMRHLRQRYSYIAMSGLILSFSLSNTLQKTVPVETNTNTR